MASGTGRNPPRTGVVAEAALPNQAQEDERMEKVTIRVKGGMVVDVTATSSEIEAEIIDEDAFDLPGYLLGDIYPQMDESDKASWSMEEAAKASTDARNVRIRRSAHSSHPAGPGKK